MEGERFYYEEDKIDYEYWKLFKELFESEEYKESLSVNAKVLYSFLSDRISLSLKNRFIDKEKRIYIFFTRDEAAELLGITKKSAIKLFKELVGMDLIEEKRFDRNKAKVIYVKKLEVKKSNLNRCEKVTSRGVKNDFFEVYNLQPIKTNITKTEIINNKTEKNSDENELLNLIKKKSELNDFEEKEMFEEVIEALFYSNDIEVCGQTASSKEIREKLSKISKSNLTNVLNIMEDKKGIKNLKGYLMKVLYSSLDSKVIQINKENIGRDYTNFDFDSLYVNKKF